MPSIPAAFGESNFTILSYLILILVLFQSCVYTSYFVTLILCMVFVVRFLYLDSVKSKRSKQIRKHGVIEAITFMNPLKPKYVLFWNLPRHLDKDIFKGCEYKCVLTTARSKIRHQDAVLFHVPNLRKWPKKPRDQVWVYYGMEAPPNLKSKSHSWRRLFNWTICYRRDSDVIKPYGSFISRNLQTTNRNASRIGELSMLKTHTAAWFVSHCITHGRRGAYVNVLRKHVGVDVYGACGPLSCPRVTHDNGSQAWDSSCLQTAEKDVKYYLSFENSLCRDYVTEKVFKVYTTQSLVPVVRGSANYSMYLPRTHL